jgi:hypothetical protein
MNKIIIGVLLSIILVGGYFMYQPYQKANKNIAEKTVQTGNDKIEKKATHKIALVAFDGSKLATELKSKGSQKIGCDDVIVYKDIQGDLSDKEILEKMFVFDDYDEKDGTYNVFSGSSKNLKVESMETDKTGTMTVKLSGELITGGTCDDPRVPAQIVKTIEQFNKDVKNIEIYINGEELSSFLSEKDDEDRLADNGVAKPVEKKMETKPVSFKKQSFILTHNGVM